jgi:molybdopterin adenylyltransferase
MYSIAIITVSDRSSRGERKDLSGPALEQWAVSNNFTVKETVIVPDEIDAIQQKLLEYSNSKINLILTTGGTGMAPRDVTPEATLGVIEKIIPGFAEVMRQKSLEITPHAILSRAVSGIIKSSLIINLPGSPKAAVENIDFVKKALPHAIDLLMDSVTDCAS